MKRGTKEEALAKRKVQYFYEFNEVQDQYSREKLRPKS